MLVSKAVGTWMRVNKPVRAEISFAHCVRNQNDDATASLLSKTIPTESFRIGTHTRGRLITNYKRGVATKGNGERQLSLVAVRQRPRTRKVKSFQANFCRTPSHFGIRSIRSFDFHIESNVFTHSETIVQYAVLWAKSDRATARSSI